MHESEGEMTSTRNGQWRMERNSEATAELKMVRLDDYMYKWLMYMFIQGWGRERKEGLYLFFWLGQLGGQGCHLLG